MEPRERIAWKFTGLCLRTVQLQAARRSLFISSTPTTPDTPSELPAGEVDPGDFLSGLMRYLPRQTPTAIRDRFHEVAIFSLPVRKIFGRAGGFFHWFYFTVYARKLRTPSRSETLMPVYEAYFILRVIRKDGQERLGVEIMNPAYTSQYLYLSDTGESRESFSFGVVMQLAEKELFPRLWEIRRSMPTKRLRRQLPEIVVGSDIAADLSGRAIMLCLPPY